MLMDEYLNNFPGHFIAFLNICLWTQKILFHYLCNYCLQESLQLNSHRHENFTYSLLWNIKCSINFKGLLKEGILHFMVIVTSYVYGSVRNDR